MTSKTYRNVGLGTSTGELYVYGDKGLTHSSPHSDPVTLDWRFISKAKKGTGDSRTKVRVTMRDGTVHVFLMESEEDARDLKRIVAESIAERSLSEGHDSLTDTTETEAFFDEEAPPHNTRNGMSQSMAPIPEHSASYTPKTMQGNHSSEFPTKQRSATVTQMKWIPSNTTLFSLMVFNMACCFMIAVIVISLLAVLVHRTNSLPYMWGYSTPVTTAVSRSTPSPPASIPPPPAEVQEPLTPADLQELVPRGDCDITKGPHCTAVGDSLCIMSNCDFHYNQFRQSMFVAICPTCEELRYDYCQLKKGCPACMEATVNPLLECKLEQDQQDECNWDLATACE